MSSAAAAADGIQWSSKTGDENVITRKLLITLCSEFELSSAMQLAFNALAAEVLRGGLQWVIPDGVVVSPKDPVPLGWQRVVRAAIKGVLVSGSFFWRRNRDSGSGIAIAHPSEAWFDDPKWKAQVLFKPYPKEYSRGRVLNSPVQRAYPFAVAVAEFDSLILNRDRMNSKPGIYTTIDKRLQSQDGRSKPWFRTVGSDFTETLSTQLDPLNNNYDTLVRDRAEQVTSLGQATIMSRKRDLGEMQASDNGAANAHFANNLVHAIAPDQDAGGKLHREHKVSDGHDIAIAQSLNSLIDGRAHVASLEIRILHALHVPPSVVGLNQNSERLASGSQLVIATLTSFQTIVSTLQTLIGDVIKEASAEKDGTYVGFGTPLTQVALDRLMPYMSNHDARRAIATAYNVPISWIDLKRVTAALDGGGTDNQAFALTNNEKAAVRATKAPAKADTAPT
jgi:hypothetical protein